MPEIMFGKNGEELRDPVKAKRFAELFPQALLPDDVRLKYVAAGKNEAAAP